LNKEAVIWKESLYYGSSGDYLDTVRQSNDQHECLLMVGHNPLIEEAVSSLCCEEGRSVVIMPTAALVCLEYPGSRWNGIRPGTTRLKWMMIPKVLKKPDDR
jgi:phosphohistidine phosphatase